MVKEILIAANTPQGFVSYFDKYIDADKVICLKGGSGVGKSTLLKAVIAGAQSHNLEVITMPCSSDINSLDMVLVGGNKLVVLDATAPHIVEPPCYGAQGEIFNLGDFLDKPSLHSNRTELKQLMSEKALHYSALYNHLQAAAAHLSNINIVYNNALKIGTFNELYATICNDYLISAVPARRVIEGFCSYLGEHGIVDCTSNIIGARVVVVVKCSSIAIARKMIGRISDYFAAHGVDCERYHSLLFPAEIDCIALDNILFTAMQNVECEYTIDLDVAIDSSLVGYRIVDIIDERGSCNREITKAADRLCASRECHLVIEKHYMQAMDFKKLEAAKATLLARLF